MFCSNCGTNNADGATFCSNCGSSLGAQPAPSYNAAPANAEQPAKGLSIASLVLGIISLIVFAYIAGTLAIVFSCVAKKKGNTSKMTTAGLILGIVGIGSWLLMQIFLGAILGVVLF